MALPRTRPAMKREILSITPLTKDDLALLREPRRAVAVKKIRDSHHHLARLFASGCDIPTVCRRTGYTMARVSRIRKSPAFENLVQEYRAMVNETWLESVDDYQEIVLGNMIRAELLVADKLAEAEEDEEIKIPMRDLLAVSRDAADRMGYGKKSTNVNVNVDFASQLEKAVRRSNAARVIDASVMKEIAGANMPRGTEAPAKAMPLLAQGHSPAPQTPATPVQVESAAPLQFRRRA